MMTPSKASSLRSGTIRRVRAPPRSASARDVGIADPVGLVVRDIRDVHDVLAFDNACSATAGPGRGCVLAQNSAKPAGTPRMRHGMKALAIDKLQSMPNAASHSRIAFSSIASNTGVEIAGRGVDHLQHLGGRGLLLQRLALLGQQPRILDRDHRLIGEGADKFDLPVGKRLDPLAREQDDADRLAFAQQRHAERCPLLAQSDRDVRIAWNGGHVVNMHGAAFEHGSRRQLSDRPVGIGMAPRAVV